MKKLFTYLFAISLTFGLFAQNNEISIIPQLTEITITNGYFTFDEKTSLSYENPEVEGVANYFANFIENACGTKLITGNVKNPRTITFSLVDDDWFGNEGYSIKVETNRIEIIAQSTSGLFRATQTLRQLLPTKIEESGSISINELKIKNCYIKDRPKFTWRGMNLDCSRHFYSKDFVKKYIDLLALHKMNTFHWHLTDDQGWRIEIKRYPLLTQKASIRTEADGSKYGGFYTQEDVKEVVAYAAERHINVVPEIEMPGHCIAALNAYPQLSCTGKPIEVETTWGVFKDVYCAGNDSVFVFLENVLSEIIELFPSKYIHIGGDEVPTYNWENCPKCQKRMKDENIKSELAMQGYFVTRIEKFLKKHNRQIIGWDEILEGGVSNSATIQAWRSIDFAKTAAEHGNHCYSSPTSHCYLDYDLESVNLEKIYNFNPIPTDLAADKHHFILGGECNMWSERANQNNVDSKVFPRLCGLSEALWSEKKDFTDFHNRLQNLYKRLDVLKVNYGYENQPLFIDANYNFKKKGFEISLRPGQDGLTFYYTTDGSTPSISSKKYTKTIFSKNDCDLKIIATRENTQVPIFERRFDKHLALNKPYTTNIEYSQSYSANGNKTLCDGFCGTGKYRDGLWQGYIGKDLEVIIDLEKSQDISSVSGGFLQSTPSWIFYPLGLEVYISNDKKDWKLTGKTSNTVAQTKTETETQYLTVNFETAKTRYVKVVVPVLKNCPDWHDAAGSPTWLFIDEIVVE